LIALAPPALPLTRVCALLGISRSGHYQFHGAPKDDMSLIVIQRTE
jgi:hypothetical protein